ncbi:CidA/LrgA family protein [Silvimonas sp.]|uniref:CidA/LrgA family protein n=1 Tax=Silvimonas sp. TaxID=2650811 RepID=UPI00283DFFE5|nr:CidA/LrgA family protein [Silvimonas sp.]MDR3428304.1 CidA/LrgA family protein [Silvimonas sp.]
MELASSPALPAPVASATSALGARLYAFGCVATQVVALSALWLVAAWVQARFDLPLPASLLGLGAMAALLFAGVVQTGWIRRGANWLLGEMLLFFVPAVLAVVNYPALILSDGWRICTVIGLSTVAVMVVTALVVDQVYRLELKLARRRCNHHA